MDMSVEMDTQLVDAIQKKLEQQGIIQSLRLQLKSHVLNVLKSSSSDENSYKVVPKIPLEGENRNNLLKHAREILESLQLPNTLTTFDKETGYVPNSSHSEPKRPMIESTSYGKSILPLTSNNNNIKSEEKSSPVHRYTESKKSSPKSPLEETDDNKDNDKEKLKKSKQDEDDHLFEVSKDFSLSSSFADSSQPESPPNRSHLAPATSFKPLGSSKSNENSYKQDDSYDSVEVPEDDESEIAISSSFEPDSPDPKGLTKTTTTAMYAPNKNLASSHNDLASRPIHNTIEVKQSNTPEIETEIQDTYSHIPGRATVRGLGGGSVVRSSDLTNRSIHNSGNNHSNRNDGGSGDNDDEYDFDEKGHEVSLHDNHSSPTHPSSFSPTSNSSNSPPARTTALNDRAWGDNTLDNHVKTNSLSSTRKSNQEEEEEEDEENVDEVEEDGDFNDDDDDDFSGYDVNATLNSTSNKLSSNKPTPMFHKVGSQLEENDNDEFEYKASHGSNHSNNHKFSDGNLNVTNTSSNQDCDDYGDDFEEEVEEEDDISVGQQESDEEDDFGTGNKGKTTSLLLSKPSSGTNAATTTATGSSKSLLHSKSGMIPTMNTLKKNSDEDAAEKERLAIVEERMKQLESEDSTGKLQKIREEGIKYSVSKHIQDEDSDEDISVASGNLDEMDFSIGEEIEKGDRISPASSEDSDLYSFLGEKPTLIHPKPAGHVAIPTSTSTSSSIKSPSKSPSKSSTRLNLSNSGDFSMSEHEIDVFTSDSYDFTTNALPADKKN